MSKEKLSKQEVDHINIYSDSWIQIIHSLTGAQLNYDDESIKFMEEYIEKMRLDPKQTLYEEKKTLIGYFFGNCLIQKYGGDWVNPEYPMVQIGTLTANPLYKVSKQFDNGLQDSISGLVAVVGVALQSPETFFKLDDDNIPS